jgi:hypothetical protein
VGIWQVTGSSSSSAPTIGAIPTGYQFTRDTRTLVLYLVDAQAQADMVFAGEQEAARERESANIVDPNYILSVMNVTTLEDEQNLREVLEVWANEPGGVRLFDLRTH